MRDWLFEWVSDVDGDGTPEAVRYSETVVLPNIDRPDGGRDLRTQANATLDGGVMVVTAGRADKADQLAPGRFTLAWGVAPDEDLLAVVTEDYARGRLVTVCMDHRWRALRVASSGAADLKVTVESGPLSTTDGDTAWLSTATEHTCTAGDTVVYAIATAGAVTLGSGTSVPAGDYLLANITIVDDLVTVTSDPSGVANARTCRILAVRPKQAGHGLTGLEIELQEVR